MTNRAEGAPVPAATIVVPTRGGAQRLPKLLDALRVQTRHDFEIVVVVDGDTDDSAGVLARSRGGLALTVIVLPENRGRSAALNAGFRAARGAVLIRCDDDLLPGPDFVAAHVARHAAAAKTDDAVGVIGLTRNVFTPTPYARSYGRRRDALFRQTAYATASDQRWRYWAANVSVTRETFDRVGGYDEMYRAYGWEDVDWGYRLARSGTPVELATELETIHTGPASTTAVRVGKAYDSGAAQRLFVAKHGDAMFAATRPNGGGGAAGNTWSRLVGAIAAVCGRRSLVILGKLIDATADYLPKYIAEKMISLLVESAALSGRRRTAEVTTEL